MTTNVGELSSEATADLQIGTQIDVGNLPPSTIAAYYARDDRDALTRLARFKQLWTPEELQIKISKDECLIEPVWQHAQEETPGAARQWLNAAIFPPGRGCSL